MTKLELMNHKNKTIDVNIPPSVYFGGCAFGSAFYVGVFNAMYERWGPKFNDKILVSGGSAGTIFALAIALGKHPNYMDSFYRNLSSKCKKHGTIYFASVFLEEAVRELLGDPMAYKALEGRFCFGTTSFFSKHRWHVSWVDNEDLISSIRGSFHIPFYCKKISDIKGIEVVDGAYGFSGWDLPHGNDTLYVGIDPHAEITRSLTYKQMMFPVFDEEYEEMVQSGYEAFMNWNGKLNKKVENRKPNYQALYVLWTLKFFEIFFHFFIDFFYLISSFIMQILKKSAKLFPKMAWN